MAPNLWITWLLPVLVADLVAIESEPADPELARVVIESCSAALSPESCSVQGAEAQDATWFARVIWAEPDRLRARIELRRGARDAAPESVRDVAFSAADDLAQRHRAVGLIIAAYVVEHGHAPEQALAPEPAVPPAETQAGLAPAAAAEPEPEPEPAPPVPLHTWAGDLALLVAPGLDRGAPRFGAALRAQFRPLAAPLFLLLGARVAHRFDEPSLLWLGPSAGLALRLQLPARGLALEVRGEIVLQRVQAEAEDPQTGVHESRGVSRLGGQLGLELHAHLGAGVGLFVGPEIAALFRLSP